MANHKLFSYRADIEGLRAAAVILVLLFHAGYQQVSGGYIGVDVFFVISGYLITQILVRDCISGRFGYIAFISRRFFRLYPALLVTLTLTLLGGFLILSPEHLMPMGKYAAAAQFSVSNIIFLLDSGYFTEEASTNPLLHTWSLAVEQQFYLVWPGLIYLAYRMRVVPIAILLAGVASFLWSCHQVGSAPESAYFLMDSRVFEFSVGAIIPWIKPLPDRVRALNEPLLLAGLALILYCALMYTKNTPFPGSSALWPCLGAALCIYAGQAQFSGVLLRNPVMRWIGSISYSVYLIHWPIFVLYGYYRYGPITDNERAVMFLVPFVIAYPLFKLVESPLRKLRFDSMEVAPGAVGAVFSVMVICTSWLVFKTNGAEWRLNAANKGRMDDGLSYHTANYGGAGFSDESILGDQSQSKVSLLLIGDSFAGHLASGLDSLLKQNHMKGFSVWQSGCLMSPHYVTGRNGVIDKKCLTLSERAIELAAKFDAPIVYAQSWAGGYLTATMSKDGKKVEFANPAEYYRFLARNVSELAATGTGHRMIVFGSPPGDGSTQGVSLKACLNRPNYISSSCQDYLVFEKNSAIGYAETYGVADALHGMMNVTFIDPYDVFCKDGVCRALLDDKVVYSDYAHLSVTGSKAVIDHFAELLLQPNTPATSAMR